MAIAKAGVYSLGVLVITNTAAHHCIKRGAGSERESGSPLTLSLSKGTSGKRQRENRPNAGSIAHICKEYQLTLKLQLIYSMVYLPL